MVFVKKFSIFLVSLCLVCLFCEAGIRVLHIYKYGIKVKDSFNYEMKLQGIYSFDEDLGWKNKNNNYGFQVYGDVNSTKKKIFVIGDSFTRCRQIPKDKTYYSYLENSGFELFVYGADAYSTLQKYQILDKFIDIIAPDYIVLQLCWNDFIENSYNLSSKSYLNVITIKRPYLIGNELKLLDPSKENFPVYLANHHSKFIRFLLSRSRLFSYNIEEEIRREKKKNSLFVEAVNITDYIFGLISKRSKDIPVIVFNVDNEVPYLEEFENLSIKHEFVFLKDIHAKIKDSLDKGIKIKLVDNAHWNELGHEIAGKILSSYFKNLHN